MKCNENNLLYFLYNDYSIIHEIHKKSFPGVKSKIQIHENLFLQNLTIPKSTKSNTNFMPHSSPNNSPILISANERHNEGNMMKMMGKSSQSTTLNPSPSPSATLHCLVKQDTDRIQTAWRIWLLLASGNVTFVDSE